MLQKQVIVLVLASLVSSYYVSVVDTCLMIRRVIVYVCAVSYGIY